jgi:steroid delta-isomerase-like uncharacterized protein
MSTEALIHAYYDAFNAGDYDAMVALLTEDVAHDINQGGRETGRAAFRAFLAHMQECYQEQLTDIVVLTDASGARAAAEFVVHGVYKASDAGLPPATGQRYVLPAGAFFDVRNGRIARVSNFYNLPSWLTQVGG